MEVFEPLSERQEYLLGLVVRAYIETGLAIGSQSLVDNYDLGVSSATVRNELARLDELGYLAQLHTSAGRIPTEMGYRYFVQRLVGEFELPQSDQQMISHQFHQARLEMEQWLRLAAAVLARTSGGAGLVTSPRAKPNYFRHLQLLSTRGRQVLMVLVLVGGQVNQQMLTLAEPLPQHRLSAAAERLNHLFAEKSASDIEARLSQLDTLELDVARLLIDTLRRIDARRISDIYRAGLVNLLEHDGTRQAVRVLEERTLLSNVLDEVMEPQASGVRVVIGSEGKWEELKDCAIILARYGVEQELTGELGVLGPARMPYSRNISAVRYVADLMSNLVTEYLADDLRSREGE